MTNANSFHSAVFVLLAFAVIYFAALLIHEVARKISDIRNKKKEDE